MVHLRVFLIASGLTLLACGEGAVEITEGGMEPDVPGDTELGTIEAKLSTSKVSHAIDYGLKLVGKPYGWWYSGPLPKGAPMWTASGPAPSPSQITSANCTGLTNLMLRSVGRPLPSDPNGWYGTGGTAAYFARYRPVSEPFNVNKAYPAGTLLMRNYRDNVDQGHVAVVLGNGRVLQSFANCYGCSAPGVNASYTVAQSHGGYYYERAVLPQHWLGSGNVECAYGDGNYCGGNGVTGDSGTLYRCVGGTKSVLRVCDNGCKKMPAGTDDVCGQTAPSAIIVDSNNARNDTAHAKIEVSSGWISSSYRAGYYGTGYYYAQVKQQSDPATFWFYLPAAGKRTVDARWTDGANRSSSASFIALDAAGNKLGTARVDQRSRGGQWNTLGTYAFTRGWNRVQLSRWGSDGSFVVADAVRIR